ncbi:MAG TPA: 50S ribosomal protein L32 [Candidatus Bathyarchaeia archaeon]|nr:50S ribosomal protein L32 [Candidatus Bathyarchaeia archaeon]
MPVPKRKRSRTRRDKRFANKGIIPQTFAHCPSCSKPCVPHVVCQFCGHYKGVQVVKVRVKKAEAGPKDAILASVKK